MSTPADEDELCQEILRLQKVASDRLTRIRELEVLLEGNGKLIFAPIPALGDDWQCSCLVCHKPSEDSDGVVRGAPVEWLVRMRLIDCTIWRGLHEACWRRNCKPTPLPPP